MGVEQITNTTNAGNMAKIIPQGTVTYVTKNTPTANYVVGPTGVNKNIPNPTAYAARAVRESLSGTGSLSASSANITLLQKNVNSALTITNKLNGTPGKANLLAAQTALAKAAASSSTTDKNAALATAKSALQAAQNEYTSKGYTGKTITSGNINIVGGAKNTKIIL
jgi:hypothetical protein